MAASVRVEDDAFCDQRIHLLGAIAGYNGFEALGRLVHLWRVCTNRGEYVVSDAQVIACLGPKGVSAIVEADLGEREANGIRVKGTRGRIEWLQSKREAGRKGGEANRRKPKVVLKQNEANGKQTASKTKPPTPTPTLTPTASLIPTPDPSEEIIADASTHPPETRERNPLWDAIVKITGADATIKTVAAHIGKVCKALKGASPPYTPEDVLALPAAAAAQLPWAAGRALTLGEVEKNIGIVRSSGTPIEVKGKQDAKHNERTAARYDPSIHG